MDLYFDWIISNYNKQENIKSSLKTVKFVVIGEIIVSIVLLGGLWTSDNPSFWSVLILLISFVFSLKSILIAHSRLKTTKLYNLYYFSEIGLIIGLIVLKRMTNFLINNYFVLIGIYLFIGLYLYIESLLKKENLNVTQDYEEFINQLNSLGISYKTTFFNLEKVYQEVSDSKVLETSISSELLEASKQLNSIKQTINKIIKENELVTQKELVAYFPNEFLQELSDTHHVLKVDTNSKEILEFVQAKELGFFELVHNIDMFTDKGEN